PGLSAVSLLLPAPRLARSLFVALDAAGLVDHRQRLGKAGERVAVGRRRTLLRGPFDHRLMTFGERRDDRFIELGGARPGAVALGEQLELLAADVERHLAVFL